MLKYFLVNTRFFKLGLFGIVVTLAPLLSHAHSLKPTPSLLKCELLEAVNGVWSVVFTEEQQLEIQPPNSSFLKYADIKNLNYKGYEFQVSGTVKRADKTLELMVFALKDGNEQIAAAAGADVTLAIREYMPPRIPHALLNLTCKLK